MLHFAFRLSRFCAVCAALLPLVLGPGALCGAPTFYGLNYTEPAGGGYDTDAQDFFDRVVANGGTISTATKGYVNTFVLAAKAHGYWASLERINLQCGDQLAACRTPLKVGGGNSMDTNSGSFAGGDYSESTGITGNGSSKYLSTGLAANWNGENSGHILVVNSGGGSDGWFVDATGSGSDRVGLFFTSSTTYYDYVGDSTGRASGSSSITGIHAGSRTASNASRAFYNGSQVGSTTTTNASGVISHEIEIFRVASVLYHSGAMRGYSIGSGLTTTQMADLTADIEAFNDSLGRGVM